MAAPKYPCYRLDPQTLQRIESIEECETFEDFNLIDPDFDTMFVLDEATIVENIVSRKEMEM